MSVIAFEGLDLDALNDTYKELSQIVGYENMEKLYDYYHGQQLSFPSRIYNKKYVCRVLQQQYDGTNVKTLARQLGYSERWIRKLIHQMKVT